MPNPQRGEAGFIAGGESFLMRLTLGALAEIEDCLGVTSLNDLAARLKAFSSSDLAMVTAALLRAGGRDMTAEEVLRLPVDLGTIVRAVADAFNTAGLGTASATATGTETATLPLSGAAASNSPSA